MTTTRCNSCILTPKDFAVLAAMLRRPDYLHPQIAALLRRKLSAATITHEDEIRPDVVTLNSRVRFRVDDGPVDERIVVHGEERGVPGMTIPITIPRGLALLGLAEGQEVTVERECEPAETLSVEMVAYQPEAARAGWARALGAPPGGQALPPEAGNVVPLSKHRARRTPGRLPVSDRPPGPSVA